MRLGRTAAGVTLLLAALAVVGSHDGVRPVSADHVGAHMVFLQQDPAWRNKKPYPSSYFFNVVNLWWSWNVYTTTWDSEPALLQAATDAINNGWKTAVPNLRFQYGNDQYPLRLLIRNGTCQFEAQIACLPDDYYTYGGGDLWPDPGAWYWYSAKIHVNLSLPGWTLQGMTDAVCMKWGIG